MPTQKDKNGHVTNLRRYPVKGLPGHDISEFAIEPGGGIPLDRKWGLMHRGNQSDVDHDSWSIRNDFLMISRDLQLGRLGADFDADTSVLSILRKGRVVSKGCLLDPAGRAVLESFLHAYLKDHPRNHPKIVQAPDGESFGDRNPPLLSIMNRASIFDLERVTGQEVDPLRFRGNIMIEGLDAWVENKWCERRLRIGEVEFQVVMMIDRCRATNVNLKSGEEDMNIPLALRKGYGHIDCGVLARVTSGGQIKIGDQLTLLPNE